jgi:hypothetical protein
MQSRLFPFVVRAKNCARSECSIWKLSRRHKRETLREHLAMSFVLTARGRIVHSVLVRNRGCNKSTAIATLSIKMIGNHELAQAMYHES